jgi:hypothetical protein
VRRLLAPIVIGAALVAPAAAGAELVGTAGTPVATSRVERMKGALVLRYGYRMEVISGGTTTVVEADDPRRPFLRRLVNRLRPVRRPGSVPRRLPAPQLPVDAWKRLLSAPSVRKDGIEHEGRLVRSDRRVLRALVRLGAGRRPACDR